MQILNQIRALIMSLIAPLLPALDDRKIMAFLRLIRYAEGTDVKVNPYAVVYAYDFTITDFSDHPYYSSHQWKGKRLPDSMCTNAGQKPGCVSTAAGAYQFIRPTWVTIKNRLSLPDFSPRSQDKAAIYLLQQCGSYSDILAGNIESAIKKAAKTWASFPGNNFGQGPKSMPTMLAKYKQFL